MRLLFKFNYMFLAGLALTLALSCPQTKADGRKDKPTGAEIARKAKKVRLNAEKAIRAEKNGKLIIFTPVDVSPVITANDTDSDRMMTAEGAAAAPQKEWLANGQVIGQLDTTQAGDVLPLDAGVYNIMVARIDGVWRSYVEANGKLVGEYIDVTVEPAQGMASQPPAITPDWCLQAYVSAIAPTASDVGGAYDGDAASSPAIDSGFKVNQSQAISPLKVSVADLTGIAPPSLVNGIPTPPAAEDDQNPGAFRINSGAYFKSDSKSGFDRILINGSDFDPDCQVWATYLESGNGVWLKVIKRTSTQLEIDRSNETHLSPNTEARFYKVVNPITGKNSSYFSLTFKSLK